MKEWNTAPPLDLPMPKQWPAISPATAELLLAWGLRQTLVRAWIMRRSLQYADAAVPRIEAQFDAYACLEALQWQTDLSGKEAVNWLKGLETATSGMDEEWGQHRK